MNSTESLRRLWGRLPDSRYSGALERAERVRSEISGMEERLRFLYCELRRLEDAVKEDMAREWDPEDIALALSDGKEEEATRHLRAAIRRQRSWRSRRHGTLPVNDILRKSLRKGRGTT